MTIKKVNSNHTGTLRIKNGECVMNKKPLAIITVGCSGSGKTHWVEEYTKNKYSVTNINRDDIRFEMFTGGKRDWTKYKFNKSNENLVTDQENEAVSTAVKNGVDIIISNTNINAKIRQYWINYFQYHNYDVVVKEFPCDWDTLVKRNTQREGGIGIEILRSQYERFNDYIGRKVYVPNESLPRAFLCDLDGTVADMKGVRKPFEWDKVGQDNPRDHIISMVIGLIESGLTPIFLSGRDGSCVEETYYWVEDNIMGKIWGSGDDLPRGFHLFMREAGDSRKDTIVKEEIFWKYIDKNFNIVSCLDDRKQVLRMWEELKIPNIINVGDLYSEF